MLTKTVKTAEGEMAIQASRREDGGWQIREPGTAVWTDLTDKKHSRDLISLYIDLIYEGENDPGDLGL